MHEKILQTPLDHTEKSQTYVKLKPGFAVLRVNVIAYVVTMFCLRYKPGCTDGRQCVT